jgi:hypothetical protein
MIREIRCNAFPEYVRANILVTGSFHAIVSCDCLSDDYSCPSSHRDESLSFSRNKRSRGNAQGTVLKTSSEKVKNYLSEEYYFFFGAAFFAFFASGFFAAAFFAAAMLESTSYRKGLYFFSICELINILVAKGFSRIETHQTITFLPVK